MSIPQMHQTPRPEFQDETTDEPDDTRWELPRPAGSLCWLAAGNTDQGRRRENNEDKFSIIEKDALYIVCDGMGGMAMGELASARGVGGIEEWFENNKARVESDRLGSDEQVQALLNESIRWADNVIQANVSENPHWRGMGTTVVLGYRVHDSLHWANVGDSRAYLLRDGGIELLTQDDSIAALLERRGELSPAEARSSHMRNELTSALGNISVKGPHLGKIQLRSKDRIILCSDGLWDMLTDSEIQRLTLEADTPGKAVASLIDAANEAGGQDNITVIAIFVAGEREASSGRDSQHSPHAYDLFDANDARDSQENSDTDFRTQPQFPQQIGRTQ